MAYPPPARPLCTVVLNGGSRGGLTLEDPKCLVLPKIPSQTLLYHKIGWLVAWAKKKNWIWASLFAGQFQNGVRTPQFFFFFKFIDP